MATGDVLTGLVTRLRHRCGDGPPDGDLLARFAARRDEAAFAELVAGGAGRMLVAAGVVVTALSIGAGVGLSGGEQAAPKAPPVPAAAVPQPRVDAEGVPLPTGVLARFGSSRMRHAQHVFQVAFAPDSKSLVSAGQDGVRLWDVTTGKHVYRLTRENAFRMGPCFSPDGREVRAVFGPRPGIFSRWDVATGRELLRVRLNDDYHSSAARSSDGRRFAVAWEDNSVRLYATADGSEVLRFAFQSEVTGRALSFSPDGGLLTIVGTRNTIGLFDIATGRSVGGLRRDGAGYTYATFFPSGRVLAALSAPDDGLVTDIDLWDVPARRHLRRISGPNVQSVKHIAISPDGRLLAQTGQLPDVILWETATGQEVRRLRCYPSTLASAFSPDGRTLAVASGNGAITLWGVETGKLLPASADPMIEVFSLRFTDGGRRLIGAAERILSWNVASGKEVDRFPAIDVTYGLPVLSPDGRLIAAISDPRKPDVLLDLFDASTGRPVRSFGRKLSTFPIPVFTPDSRRVIVGDTEKIIHVFDVATGQELGSLSGHFGRPNQIVVSPDGRWLASASNDTRAGDFAIRLWDLKTIQEVRRLIPLEGAVFRMTFSTDGRRLFAGGGDNWRVTDRGVTQIWDVESGRPVRSFESTSSSCIAASPDDRTIATDDSNGSIRMWEAATGSERYRLWGHAGRVRAIAFSPDGRTLAASSPDAPVYLWDVYGRSENWKPPTADDLSHCWADLAAADAAAAFRAVRRLVNAPDAAVALLRERLKPVPAVDTGRIKELIAKLDSPKFADRQAATKELDAIADGAADVLRTALAATTSAEVRTALQAILDRLGAGSPETWRALRAVEVLEQVGSPAAREHLKALSGGAPAATLTRAAAEAIKRLR